METVATLLSEELAETAEWGAAPPPALEEQELDVLAFELWQRGSCPEMAADDDWLSEEEALRCHASCL
ncbi:MAG TPA: hypothetical protein VFA33_27040 [Bryobacteraceae bacterium]|nr:hypothetical protein [Bryobacteraceae bacterium]